MVKVDSAAADLVSRIIRRQDAGDVLDGGQNRGPGYIFRTRLAGILCKYPVLHGGNC